MPPERRFKDWFIRNLPGNWHAQTIETTTGRGVPDVNLSAKLPNRNLEMWLELKGRHRCPLLRPEQFAWLMRRQAAGGVVGVLHCDRELPWKLHIPRHWFTCSRNLEGGPMVEIVSEPFAVGTNHPELLKVLSTL